MPLIPFLLIFFLCGCSLPADGFSLSRSGKRYWTLTRSFSSIPRRSTTTTRESSLAATSDANAASASTAADGDDGVLLDDEAIQWDLLNKHHAKGSWKGVWTTYDYMGDVMDETVASVDLVPTSGSSSSGGAASSVQHTHTIVVGAKRSDCPTCFDSMETTTLPVGEYRPNGILQKRSRLAGISMINGPTILRKTGAMATELVLKHGDGRVRAIFQHAPVWEAGVEPGSCPPQGLKLFRAMVSREAVRRTAPTAETEAADPPIQGNPVFFRPVPPFNWHKKWAGTSWTWGPQRGNQGWSLDELDETDAWQGITPVDCWNLRLPGGIHLQAPRVVTDATVGICRLAWLPDDETLLRVEAGVSALQPEILEDDRMVGFAPPSLSSLRCDMLQKVGELEDAIRPSRDWNGSTLRDDTAREDDDGDDDESMTTVKSASHTPSKTKPAANNDDTADARDSLSL